MISSLNNLCVWSPGGLSDGLRYNPWYISNSWRNLLCMSVYIDSSQISIHACTLKYTSSEPPSSKLCQLVGALKMSRFTGSSSLPSPQTRLGGLSRVTRTHKYSTHPATHQWFLLEQSPCFNLPTSPIVSWHWSKHTWPFLLSLRLPYWLSVCIGHSIYALIMAKPCITSYLRVYSFWKRFRPIFFSGERAYPSTQRLLERDYFTSAPSPSPSGFWDLLYHSPELE